MLDVGPAKFTDSLTLRTTHSEDRLSSVARTYLRVKDVPQGDAKLMEQRCTVHSAVMQHLSGKMSGQVSQPPLDQTVAHGM